MKSVKDILRAYEYELPDSTTCARVEEEIKAAINDLALDNYTVKCAINGNCLRADLYFHNTEDLLMFKLRN